MRNFDSIPTSVIWLRLNHSHMVVGDVPTTVPTKRCGDMFLSDMSHDSVTEGAEKNEYNNVCCLLSAGISQVMDCNILGAR